MLLAAAVPSRPATVPSCYRPPATKTLDIILICARHMLSILVVTGRCGQSLAMGCTQSLASGSPLYMETTTLCFLRTFLISQTLYAVLYNHLHATNFHAVMWRVNCRRKSTYVGHGMQAGRDYFQGCKLWGGSGDVHSCNNCCAPTHRTRPSCIFDDIPTLFAVQRDLVVPHYPTRAATLLVFFTMVAQQAHQQ